MPSIQDSDSPAVLRPVGKKDQPNSEENSKQHNATRKPVTNEPVPLKYGPMPTFPHQRVWSRMVIIIAVMIIVYFASNKGKKPFALQRDIVQLRTNFTHCSLIHQSIKSRPVCTPEHCGLMVSDSVLSETEKNILMEMAKSVLAVGGQGDEPIHLNLHTGHMRNKTANINLFQTEYGKKIFKNTYLNVYRSLKHNLKDWIKETFNVKSLYTAEESYFQKITEADSVIGGTLRPHSHAADHESITFNAMIYLSDFGIDFEGGRLVFLDKHSTIVEPRKGRVTVYSTALDVLHFVEPVRSGQQLVITLPFSCDIADPRPFKEQ